MTPATKARPSAVATTVDPVLLAKYQAIFGVDGFLRTHNVERNEEIEILGLATISGVDTLFLGDPGTGKTWLIELLVDHCLSDMQLFSHLFAKDQSADEVLGPRDIMAMKAGKIERLTAGFMPRANYVYGDEIFKASPPMLNPLLDLLANRVLKVGGTVHQCKQLITIIMSSNELPDREDLQAFRDRIGITMFVQPVRTPEGRRAVTDIQLDFQASGLNTAGLVPLSLNDIYAIRNEVKAVRVNEVIRQVMVDAQEKWAQAGHPPSQRRIGQMWKIVKARAWANGRTEVVADDFLPCQHMAWNHPDHAKSAREIILEFASAFTRKAQRLREAMEPIAASTQELRAKIEATTDESEINDLMGEGYGYMRQLRQLRTEGRKQVKEGVAAGQDTTLLTEVLDEISRLYGWAEKALTGTDDEDE